MEKINFQNATLKTQAHVVINGQTYNVVDSEYTGGDKFRRRNSKLCLPINASSREYIYDNC